MHAAGARLAFQHEHAGHDREDLAIELLGAVIDRARQRAFHHVNVMADLGQVERLLSGDRGAGTGSGTAIMAGG